MKKMLIFVTTLLLVIGASAIVAPCWGQNIDVEEDQTEMDDDGGNGGGGDSWRAGYKMERSLYIDGFSFGFSFGFPMGVSFNPQINTRYILCCIDANQNTACNFSNQSPEC